MVGVHLKRVRAIVTKHLALLSSPSHPATPKGSVTRNQYLKNGWLTKTIGPTGRETSLSALERATGFFIPKTDRKWVASIIEHGIPIITGDGAVRFVMAKLWFGYLAHPY